MSADDFIQYLSWAVYIVISIATAAQAVRRPLRANLDIALLFSLTTLIIAASVVDSLRLLPDARIVSGVEITLLLAIPFMLLRLVDDFSDVPAAVSALALGVLVVLAAAAFAAAPHPPGWLTLIDIVYLVGLLLYGALAFEREARRATGVTRRRMHAAALGSLFLCLDFLIDGLPILSPTLASMVRTGAGLAGLASGLCYYLGFAPPSLFRRAWQEPELRRFLSQAARLPRLPDTAEIIAEMERGAATSVGVPHAVIGVWDAAAGVLRFGSGPRAVAVDPATSPTVGGAFLRQQAVLAPDVARENPAHVAAEQAHGVRAVLAAPITAGAQRLGVLVVYAARGPIFAEDDLALIQLLADQAAVVLESRALIDDAARVRAHEEALRMKEDFLSAAAHDLKTPLTTMVAQAQLLQRRAQRQPQAPPDLDGLERLLRETQRLKNLVLELLDASRAEQGRLVGARDMADLTAVAAEVCARRSTPRHPCRVEAAGPAPGLYDPVRIRQLIENLLENAVKYSPAGGEVVVQIRQAGAANRLSVTDHGIGIPAADLPRLFERFHRGSNVDDRRFAGMGLGLYICRAIAEQHGGRIAVASAPGAGTTFTVTLPALDAASVPELEAVAYV